MTILRLHLLEGKHVSDLCEQYKINPGPFYQWQRTLNKQAILGSNPSAAVDSNTAGLGGVGRPGRRSAGSTTKK